MLEGIDTSDVIVGILDGQVTVLNEVQIIHNTDTTLDTTHYSNIGTTNKPMQVNKDLYEVSVTSLKRIDPIQRANQLPTSNQSQYIRFADRFVELDGHISGITLYDSGEHFVEEVEIVATGYSIREIP